MRLSLFLALLLFPIFAGAQNSPDSVLWDIRFFFPYQNDLSLFEDSINIQLEQSDWDESVVVNYVFSTCDNPASFADLLAMPAPPARHYAVIYAGHSGRMHELEMINCGADTSWTSVVEVKRALREFIGEDKLDLFFFQNCSKSTLGPIFELSDVARYTLSSQFPLGAPNYYYKPVLEAAHTIDNGHEFGKAIMESDSPGMYFSYTLVDSRMLEEIVEFMDDKLVVGDSLNLNSQMLYKTAYGSELFVDLLDLVVVLEMEGEISSDLAVWVKEKWEACFTVRISDDLMDMVQQSIAAYSGLSICIQPDLSTNLSIFSLDQWKRLYANLRLY